jgi:hypothetical protein
VSTIALKILELVKSLPPVEQRTICAELARHVSLASSPRIPGLQKTASGEYFNPDGIPNDHPFFKILEEDEAARQKDFGPPLPAFD